MPSRMRAGARRRARQQRGGHTLSPEWLQNAQRQNVRHALAARARAGDAVTRCVACGAVGCGACRAAGRCALRQLASHALAAPAVRVRLGGRQGVARSMHRRRSPAAGSLLQTGRSRRPARFPLRRGAQRWSFTSARPARCGLLA